MADVDTLFRPLALGALELPNRIVMAPLTRNRARPDGVPGPLAADYYRQRASAGLIVSEATQISPMGKGYLDTPGVHDAAQVEGWRAVTQAVHAAGGRIVLQLWHVGRISNRTLLPGGAQPVSASAVRATAKTYTATGFEDVSEPRALTLDEITATIADYAAATRNARAAGFDGVEVHGANGYLIDQFLQDGVNRREDRYGGALENRMRFGLEAVDAVVAAWSSDRVGVRIGPLDGRNDVSDSAPDATFDAWFDALDRRGLAYIHVAGTNPGPRLDAFVRRSKARARTPVITNGGFDAARAAEWVAQGWADAVAFGVPFIANPDLVARIRRGAALNEPRRETFYGGGAEGYTDYPALVD